ncbi:MAG: hypothetical protein VB093_10160 [Propionicimonas sp.]|nr:hypothetical protein [Propionicimonas sp.]NLI86180.1 hypothetical protein [Propionibacterium sp.]
MVRRSVIDLGLGLVLAVVGQFAQLAASGMLPVLGLPHPYDMAPEDGSVPQALLDQISSQFVVAAVIMLVLTFGLGWLRKVRGPVEGARTGAIWAMVVGVSQFLLGLGQGAVPVMGLVGTWVYLTAIVLGPILVGVIGARRPAR